MAKHTEETKKQALNLYISGLNFKEIAEELGINAKTVSSWKTTDWDTLRAMQGNIDIENLARNITQIVLLKYHQVLQKLNDNGDTAETVEELASLAESLHKVANSNKKLMPEVSLKTVKYELLYELCEHIKTQYPDQVKSIIPIVESFMEVV